MPRKFKSAGYPCSMLAAEHDAEQQVVDYLLPRLGLTGPILATEAPPADVEHYTHARPWAPAQVEAMFWVPTWRTSDQASDALRGLGYAVSLRPESVDPFSQAVFIRAIKNVAVVNDATIDACWTEIASYRSARRRYGGSRRGRSGATNATDGALSHAAPRTTNNCSGPATRST